MSDPVRSMQVSPVTAPVGRLKRVLLVGLRQTAVERLVPALRRGVFEVAPARTGPIALAACGLRRYDLIVAREPVEGIALEDLVARLRESGGPSSRAFVLILTDDERVEDLTTWLDDRCDACHWADFGRLLGVISREVLGVAPRVTERFMAEVSTRLAGGAVSRFYQVENISESGLLIKTRDPLAIGERVTLSFTLPGVARPVRVAGHVVRHTDATEADGFAIRFDEFADVSFRRLRDFLNE